MIDSSHPYFDNNLSWLSYNHRFLQEAWDETVPPKEKLRFIAAHAKQLGDFLRTRLPILSAMRELSPDLLDKLHVYPGPLMEQIETAIQYQLNELDELLTGLIIPELASNNVHLYFKENFDTEHFDFIHQFFLEKVFRHIQPIFLNSRRSSKAAFLAIGINNFIVNLDRGPEWPEPFYGCVNIPSDMVGRFVELPSSEGMRHIAFLDDIVKHCLPLIFPEFNIKECYAINAERETEIKLEDEYPTAIENRIRRQLEKRNFVKPSFFYYEAGLPKYIKEYLHEKFGIQESEMFEMGRYLNYKDFADVPLTNRKLAYAPLKLIRHPKLTFSQSIFSAISAGDQLLHLPYHTNSPLLQLFNEAAVDPFVKDIYVSLYKISANSFVVNSLLSASKNGKRVTAIVELNPKRDAQENLLWAKQMKDAGIKIIFSPPGLKAHAKMALIKRKMKRGWERYAYLGTGGFYKLTSRELVDHVLLTSRPEITNELELLFGFLGTGQEPGNFKFLPFNKLLVSQFNMTKRLVELIDAEIQASKLGRDAQIILKVNQLQDKTLIDKLYHAARFGVKVTLIVGDCCCLIADLPSISDNITVLRLVDRFVENTRVFYFYHQGEELIFMSSGDWTYRNLHKRIDITFPIDDQELKEEVKQTIVNYLSDNVKMVKLDLYQNNILIKSRAAEIALRAQEANQRLVERLSVKGERATA